MARSGTGADLAQLNEIFQEFVESEPLHAISTHGKQFLAAYRIASPANGQNASLTQESRSPR